MRDRPSTPAPQRFDASSRLVDRLGHAILALDSAGEVKIANRAAAELFGRPAAALQETGILVHLEPSEAQAFVAALRRLCRVQSETPVSLPVHILAAGHRKAYLTRPADDPDLIFLVVEPAAELPELESASPPTPLTLTDTRRRILYLSPEQAATHGYRTPELLGRDVVALAAPDCRNTELGAGSLQRDRRWRQELVGQRKDGTSFPVHVLSEVMRSASGRPLGIASSWQEIDRRHGASGTPRPRHQTTDGGEESAAVSDAAELNEALDRGSQLATAIRHAVAEKQVSFEYQPIVALADHRIAGFEALARWRHPRLGLVPPSVFVPIAEETGTIHELGAAVLEAACHRIQQWRSRHRAARRLRLSVNLSPRQLSEATLPDQVSAALDCTGLPAERLMLEVTESAVVGNLDSATRILSTLRRRGVHICIDDFGAGYSSLSYLSSFPVDALKIDRSFIQRLGTPDARPEMIEALLHLAEELGLEVIAEGVETPSQLRSLREMRCALVQGYLFSPPLPPERARRLLTLSPRLLPRRQESAPG